MDVLLLLLTCLPLVSALAVRLAPAGTPLRAGRISATFSVLTLLAALVLFAGQLLSPHHSTAQSGQPLLLLDPLGTLMALVIAAISLVVHLYSLRYMAEEPRYAHFFMLLDLMTASLILMVTAGNLILLLVAWHLIGVLLYFLLGFETRSRSAQRYALWTLLTYRLGDLPIVIAAVLLYHAYGTLYLPHLFELVRDNPSVTAAGIPVVMSAAALIVLSAFARSAQFLLHTWLPYTMEGPTPVSALMHAGIVNAGAFVINRFAPLFIDAGPVLHWAFLVGLLTAIIGSMLMLIQNDIKKSLGYSTMGQMGFMIMECGLGAFSLAIFHLIAHGLFKGTLFLSSGGVIGSARHSDNVPKNSVYTFVVERQPSASKPSWLAMALLTVAVPALLLGFAHWFVSNDIFQEQGAVILLFFGWMTGAQLLYSIHRMETPDPWRMIALAIFSLLIIVVGYTLISYAFGVLLYPDEDMRLAIYHAAGITQPWFYALVGVITLFIFAGWLLVYRSDRRGGDRREGVIWLAAYTHLSRELYISDFYSLFGRVLFRASARLNRWLRWL
ncbi:proton-conducting transporter transmembrane domain-containing protein [Acidihalobacter prosperus]|uniref:NADH dehydrogenase n=1 Tax=Acidihalobacter prosperus TaxID=160660 RepID=A0A1A6C0J5_9GAMM|nr:proton-conducting transporter membrane subunit [Acidihalobacter prosperus]OBS08082.1 NADH dehydrogenase [Acidihalobacter prosperus]